MNFAEALAKIRLEDSKLAERVVDVNHLTIEPDGLNAAGEQLHLSRKGFEQLCDRFHHQPGVPASYIASLPAPLSTQLLHHHLNAGFEGGYTIALYLRGEEVNGIGRPDLVRLPGTDVMEAVLDGMGGREHDLEITRLGLADDSIRFDLVTQRAEREIRPGDVVYAGVSVSHSLTGEFATRVEGHLHRLVCRNGAIHRECLGPRRTPRTRRLSANHPRARHQQREQIRRLAMDALARLNERLDGLRRLTAERADLEHLGPNWLRRSRLSPDRLMPFLRQAHVEEGGEETAYGIMNAFTRVATHNTELSPNVRNVLARMGGLLAFGHSRLCPKCWSLIAAGN
jgi:hypothetical protein